MLRARAIGGCHGVPGSPSSEAMVAVTRGCRREIEKELQTPRLPVRLFPAPWQETTHHSFRHRYSLQRVSVCVCDVVVMKCAAVPSLRRKTTRRRNEERGTRMGGR